MKTWICHLISGGPSSYPTAEEVSSAYNLILKHTTLFSRTCGVGLTIVHVQCMAGIVAMIYLIFSDASDHTDGNYALFVFITTLLGCFGLLFALHMIGQEILDAVRAQWCLINDV
jgi:hypothetical protein